jgi:putative RNA 2'-phosphotransferase
MCGSNTEKNRTRLYFIKYISTLMEKNRAIEQSIKMTSKKLSYILRHNPQSIGIKMDDYGWVDVETLCEKLLIDNDYLDIVVETSDKKRFRYSDDFTKIKANQGHSEALNIKNDMEAINPPFEVYHGTKKELLDTIMKEGLKPMSRQHVHLSPDVETAKMVAGRRKGDNIILVVKTKAMYADKVKVYQSENNYYLADYVDPKYIEILED